MNILLLKEVRIVYRARGVLFTISRAKIWTTTAVTMMA